MAPLNILICGGGIAGPAAAFWLSKLGHTCTIVERHPELRAHGQQIDLREQGVTVARRMGILDEVRRRAVDEEGTGFVDARGRIVAFFGRSGSEEHQSFTSEFEIMRGELCRILFDATSDRVRYRYGVTVDGFDPVGHDGSRVRVVFSDGQTAEYDLLIGADGQGSRVRRTMSPNASYRAFGVFCCYFNMARGADDRNRFLLCAPGQRRAMATRWHSKDLGQGYLMTMSHADEMRKALQSQDPVAQRDLFARVFRGAGWQSERLVNEMQRAEDVYVFEALQVTTKPWSKGRVVLLGDAAHAPSFFTGMGTSLALVGAYVLAGELARHGDDVSAALAAYDVKLRPFVEEMQELSPGFPGIMYPDSVWAVRLTHWILGFVAFVKLDRLLGTLARYLMPEGKKWKVPDYPELDLATQSWPAKC